MPVIIIKKLLLSLLILSICWLPTFGSQHEMFSAQNKSAVVADGGGDVEFPTISGLLARYYSGDVVSGDEPADDTDVSTWQDLGGSGYDITQGNSSKQPSYNTNIINGRPAIYWDGSDDVLSNTSAWTPDAVPNTVVMVYSTESGSNYYFDGELGERNTLFVDGSDIEMFAGSQYDTGFNLTTSGWHYAFFIFDSTSSYARIDGVDGSTGDSGTQTFGNEFWLGSRYSDNNFFKGYIAEVLVYDSALDSGEISSLESYITDHYNL